DEFLSYAVKAEEDAAVHYEQLTKAMEDVGNQEVAKLFAQLARFSRMHLAEAQSRASAIDGPKHLPPEYVWADSATPERADIWPGEPGMSRRDALRVALRGEKRAFEFYYQGSGTAKDPKIREAAKEVVEEESEHVRILEAWIT